MNANFDSIARADALTMLGADAEFSEAITYEPRGEKPRRRIYGSINRTVRETRVGMVHGRAMGVEVEIPNHPTKGIVPNEIDNGDKLTLKIDGKNEETRTISLNDNQGQPLVTWDAMAVRIVLV